MWWRFDSKIPSYVGNLIAILGRVPNKNKTKPDRHIVSCRDGDPRKGLTKLDLAGRNYCIKWLERLPINSKQSGRFNRLIRRAFHFYRRRDFDPPAPNERGRIGHQRLKMSNIFHFSHR